MTFEDQYVEHVDPWGTILTVEEFMVGCRRGTYVDFNGSGHPALDRKGNYMMDETQVIFPSKRFVCIPDSATHIVWVPNE